MIFKSTSLPGAFLVDLELLEDDRGFFARSFCEAEFKKAGLESELVQCSISFNKRKGTLRGLHFQAPPFSEAKLVRVTRGEIFDVLLDVRPQSPTFEKWETFRLDAHSRTALYVPAGVAHGFQTLEPDTEIFYQMSHAFRPEGARTLLWNDPKYAIPWPLQDVTLSEKDRRGGE